jgi:branched-chain amino acid transport system ATP-binding protein
VIGVSAPAELQVRRVSKSYGGLDAVADVSFSVRGADVLGIAGPNGAGKTTLFDLITGFTQASGGDVLLDEASIVSASVHHRCHLGLARTFQQPTVAGSLTVYENVLVGAQFGHPREHWDGLVDGLETHAEFLLELTGLTDKAALEAGPLGLFDKKRLMIASALATGPRVLLLDEPFGGLNPDEIEATLELLAKVRDFGVAVVCIEHVMRALVRLASHVVVMHHGTILFEGPPAEMLTDERVIEVYLGQRADGGERSQ